ncbi:hypothetical protein BJ138DRAFT_1017347, partial [Hygrophoropsis aurantiaca]
FTDSHPQRSTYLAKLKEDDCNIVPNFIGGALPRADHGDREYYCCTMLSLFQPWRTGLELKSEEETWDSSFEKHSFTSHQKELMTFFNLRYECLDARDDYSAQRKKMGCLIGLPMKFCKT